MKRRGIEKTKRKERHRNEIIQNGGRSASLSFSSGRNSLDSGRNLQEASRDALSQCRLTRPCKSHANFMQIAASNKTVMNSYVITCIQRQVAFDGLKMQSN